MSRLAGKRCIVTGAAGGIGGAVLEAFEAAGARVTGFDREARGQVRPLDTADEAAVDRAVAEAAEAMGGLDVLVTAAALTGGTGTFPAIALADWDRYIGVNLTGTFLACRAAARLMMAAGPDRLTCGGAIVTIGSVNGPMAEPGAAQYVASKGGVAALTRAMAVDLGPHRIRANMIAPGPITVPRNAALFSSPALVRTFAHHLPAGGPGRAGDIAAAALFLASDESAFVNGSVLTVDGGLSAQILKTID
jgi:NAD(P)-dependent dehydrogenase (short-subunit alcohol dehydrogenase family)